MQNIGSLVKPSSIPTIKNWPLKQLRPHLNSPSAPSLKTQSIRNSEGELRSAFPHCLMKCLSTVWNSFKFSQKKGKAIKQGPLCFAQPPTRVFFSLSLRCTKRFSSDIPIKITQINPMQIQQASDELPLHPRAVCWVKDCLNRLGAVLCCLIQDQKLVNTVAVHNRAVKSFHVSSVWNAPQAVLTEFNEVADILDNLESCIRISANILLATMSRKFKRLEFCFKIGEMASSQYSIWCMEALKD